MANADGVIAQGSGNRVVDDERKVDVLLFGFRQEELVDAREVAPEVARRRNNLKPAGFDLREVEHVIQDGEQGLRAVPDRLAELALLAGFPEGLFTVVTGSGSVVGQRFVSHPDVRKVVFTGSTQVGTDVAAGCARELKPVTLELGGNDAAIVLEDVDLNPDTIDRMRNAMFRMAGQVCMAIKRLYVPESIKGKFLDALTASVEKIVVGDGRVPEVTMGPLHTQQALERANGLVADATQRGAGVARTGPRQVEHALGPERRHEPAVARGPAQLVAGPGRVDDVVAVSRPGGRLQHRRQVGVRHAEVGEVVGDGRGVVEPEPRVELQPVGGERRGHEEVKA